MKNVIFLLFLILCGCNQSVFLGDKLTIELNRSFAFVQLVDEDNDGLRTYSLKDSIHVQYILKCETRYEGNYNCSIPVRIR